MDQEITPKHLANRYKTRFGEKIPVLRISERCEGVNKTPKRSIWFSVPRDLLVDAVRELKTVDYPHLSVISAVDTGDAIDLLYHLTIGYGKKNREILVTFTVAVPKADPVVPTISGEIPGAVYTEREKQEMIGVTVTGIPDNRGLFLPDDFPVGVYPWRKDETGIRKDMVKELWKVDRPTDRPTPPVSPPIAKKPDSAEETDGCEPDVPVDTPANADGKEVQS